MALAKRSIRAYGEAHRRRVRGCHTDGWTGDEDEVDIWMDAFKIAYDGGTLSPWAALTTVIQRRADRVSWVDSVISDVLAQEMRAWLNEGNSVDDFSPSPTVRDWLNESRREETILAKTAKLTLDAGIQNTLAERTANEGRVAVDAIVAALDAAGVIDQDSRMKAFSAMQKVLMQRGSEGPDRPVIEQ